MYSEICLETIHKNKYAVNGQDRSLDMGCWFDMLFGCYMINK